MKKNHQIFRTSSQEMSFQFTKSGNPLEIGQINYIWDLNRGQLILIIESKQMFFREIKPLLKGTSLILESPLISSYDKPFRTHLIDREVRDEFEKGIMDIGFSEIRLKPQYQYSVVSWQVVDPHLLKVILGFRSAGEIGHN